MSQFLWLLSLFSGTAMLVVLVLLIREWISPTTMDPGAKALGIVGLATTAGLAMVILAMLGLELLVSLVVAAILPILEILVLVTT